MAFFGLQTPQNYKYWYIKLFWMFRNPNTPLWLRKNLHFWKFQNFSIFLGVAKSTVFGGQRGGVWALNPFIRSSNIWGYMVLSFFGSKKVNFEENIGGAFKAPPPNRIFLTPRQIGLKWCSRIGPSILWDQAHNTVFWNLWLIPEPNFFSCDNEHSILT